MSSSTIRELVSVPSLRDHWVAIDPRGLKRPSDRVTPLSVSLKSGALVVDADQELDVLCERLRASKETSLTIVYASAG